MIIDLLRPFHNLRQNNPLYTARNHLDFPLCIESCEVLVSDSIGLCVEIPSQPRKVKFQAPLSQLLSEFRQNCRERPLRAHELVHCQSHPLVVGICRYRTGRGPEVIVLIIEDDDRKECGQ